MDAYSQIRVGPAFLDCGAHSVHTGVWPVLPIDDYIQFVNENHESFSLIAAPDVVGDTDKTKENFKYFIERVTIPKEKILSVFHLQSRDIGRVEEVFDYSQKAGLSWTAIGGALGVGFTPIQKILSLEEVYKRLKKRGSPFKVHLFGIPDPQSIKMFKPESVDSSNYIYKSTYTKFHEYNLSGWKVMPADVQHKSRSREAIHEECLNRLRHHRHRLEKFNINIDDEDVGHQLEKIPDTYKFMMVNGLNVVEFEEYVREKLKYPFRHYITMPFSSLATYNGAFVDIMECVYRNRGLISYANLRDVNPNVTGFVHELLKSPE